MLNDPAKVPPRMSQAVSKEATQCFLVSLRDLKDLQQGSGVCIIAQADASTRIALQRSQYVKAFFAFQGVKHTEQLSTDHVR